MSKKCDHENQKVHRQYKENVKQKQLGAVKRTLPNKIESMVEQITTNDC